MRQIIMRNSLRSSQMKTSTQEDSIRLFFTFFSFADDGFDDVARVKLQQRSKQFSYNSLYNCYCMNANINKKKMARWVHKFIFQTHLKSDLLSTLSADFSLSPIEDDEDNKLGSAQISMIIVRKASINCLIAICIPLCI